MQTGQTVKFNQGDAANTQLIGIISRIWPSGKTVTVKTEGPIAGTTRTYVRDITSVQAA